MDLCDPAHCYSLKFNTFTQEMVCNAKAAEMTSTYNQLLSMWNGLDVLIQTQIPMPEASMTFQQFFGVVDQREPILYSMAHQNQRDCEFCQEPREQRSGKLPDRPHPPVTGP